MAKAARILKQGDVKEKLFNVGTEPVASSPDELAATMKSDISRWSKVFNKKGDIRPE